MKYLLSLFLFLSSVAQADTMVLMSENHEAFVHATAHIGASFALQTVFYGMSKEFLGYSFIGNESLALVETLLVGFAYKASENAPFAETATSMTQNTVGALLAIGTHLTFHF